MTRRLAVLGCLLALAVFGCRGTPGSHPLSMVDLFTFAKPAGLTVTGLEGPEHDAVGAWRWSLGPRTEVRFFSSSARPYVLRFAFMNPVPGRVVTLRANGRLLGTYGPLPAVKWLTPSVADAVRFPAVAGENILSFDYADWNGRTAAILSSDDRPLAVAFLRFLLYAAAPAGSGAAPAPAPRD